MAELLRRTWRTEGAIGLPRRDRQSCQYDAYVPDPLVSRSISLDGRVAADVADAEAAIARLNLEVTTLADTEVLARLLLRAESVASSRIEGLEVGGRRLLMAELARRLDDNGGDITAAEVLGNIDAMVWAIEAVSADEPISLPHLLEVHRRLLAGTRLDAYAGRLRTEQNWIGGSSYNPCSAAFVPPPPEMVEGLLADLCAFCNQDSLPGSVQAALAHAQFETIHPFIDGNGRTGRVLVHMVLKKRGLAARVLPPVSLILATWATDYVDALTATRYVGTPDSTAAQAGLNRWLELFATACKRAVDDAMSFEQRMNELRTAWRERLGPVRARSALALLIRSLTGAPIVTVSSAAELIDRSFQATNEAIEKLVAAGILTQINVGRRNRAFEAREVVDAFSELERRLANPRGNTRVSSPARRVPPRP